MANPTQVSTDGSTLIIEIRKGGLGDHLFYSHLPRIAKQTGAFDKVYISNRSTIRRRDHWTLVWELNPFVDGFTDSKGVFRFSAYHNESQNMLDSIMLSYGLDDGLRFHEPEIFYTPTVNPDLAGTNIYDPNYQSGTGKLMSGRLIDQYFRDHDIAIHYQMEHLGKKYLPIQLDRYYACPNTFVFCDLIASANRIYCLTTGTATLAAALNKGVTVFYGDGLVAGYRHSRKHHYVGLGTDYELKDYATKCLRDAWSVFVRVANREPLFTGRPVSGVTRTGRTRQAPSNAE
jgi:hypothetical protein